MGGEAELRQQFIVWLENCRLRLAVADGREQLRTEMVAIAQLLAAPNKTQVREREDADGV